MPSKPQAIVVLEELAEYLQYRIEYATARMHESEVQKTTFEMALDKVQTKLSEEYAKRSKK